MDDRLLAMDGSRLRLGAGHLGGPSKTCRSLGRRSLGASPRRLGIRCRPLAVKQQGSARLVFVGGYKSDSSATPTADSRHDFNSRRSRERRRHDHWLDDWNRAVRLHAAEPHGLGRPHTKKWHVVGALAHGPPLIAAFSSLDVFASMGVFGIIWVPITFHIIFL